ncbi:MAG TPA: DUF4762 domain-containing protein [Enterobacter sp.]|nr:DUF4762 domain-containing protein [Enterobacter sp.]
MKKINMTEASAIIGGTCETCENTYELMIVNGSDVCAAVTTCTDKNGVVTRSYKVSHKNNCPAIG